MESRVIFISKCVLQVVRRSFMNEYIYEIEREREREICTCMFITLIGSIVFNSACCSIFVT